MDSSSSVNREWVAAEFAKGIAAERTMAEAARARVDRGFARLRRRPDLLLSFFHLSEVRSKGHYRYWRWLRCGF